MIKLFQSVWASSIYKINICSPEQPHQDKNTLTSEQPKEQVKEQPQPKKEVQSKIGWLPQTGADLTSWISMAAGALLLIVGGVIFLKRKNA